MTPISRLRSHLLDDVKYIVERESMLSEDRETVEVRLTALAPGC
jgi:hypothetical protein